MSKAVAQDCKSLDLPAFSSDRIRVLRLAPQLRFADVHFEPSRLGIVGVISAARVKRECHAKHYRAHG